MNAPVKIDEAAAAPYAPVSMLLTLKLRLNPERRQHRALERITEQQRQLWNGMLEEFIESYRRKLGSSFQIAWGTYKRRDGSTGEGYVVRQRVSDHTEDIPQPSESVHSKALTLVRGEDPAFADIQRRIQRETISRFWGAVKAFYRRAKEGAGAQAGYPRFKRREDLDGFGFDAFQQIRFDGRGLWFDGMPGKLRIHIDRPLPPTLLFTIRKGKTDFKPGDAFSISVHQASDGSRTATAAADAANIGDGMLVLDAPSCRGAVAVGIWRLVCRAKGDKDDGRIVFDLIMPDGRVLDRASPGMAYDNIKSVWFARRDEWSPRSKRACQVWYCGFAVRVPLETSRAGMGKKPIGVDWGTSVLAALSNGEMIGNPRPQEKRLAEMARRQRAVDRKQKGSKGRRNARARLQHLQRTIAFERKRRLDKLSKRLVTHFALIAMEDLDVKGLMDAERPGEKLPEHVKRRRNREALDAAPYKLRQMVDYKARLYAAEQRLVDPKHTSAECLWCGGLHFKELTDAEHVCTARGKPSFGRREPRKVHAAKVIERRGLYGIPSPVDGSGGGLVPGGAKRRSGAVCLGNTEGGRLPPGQRQGNPDPQTQVRKKVRS